ncbi:MAG: phosphate ABC transporter, permease protein PstA, partial [Bifidobacterium crudilactis]|nr:phosphate ABC transporter, permease protein PstA [Bifidobacterium crudilactis]
MSDTISSNTAAPVDDKMPSIDFDKFKPTRSFLASRKRKDMAMRVLIVLAFFVALIPLISLLWTTISSGVARLNLNFLTYNMSGVVGGNPTQSGGYGGILHAIIGTLLITLGAMVISIPIGLMCAVYLVEYSNNGKLAKSIALLVDVMSGIPSIVAGLF